MKYRCLLLDHDDTVVNSTATVHYPAFLAYLQQYRPTLCRSYTLQSYFEKNFHPGILSLLRDEVGLSEEELALEDAFWKDYARRHTPHAYDGFSALLSRFRAEGGIIAVNSHSYEENIRRDYENNGLPMPERIFGWDLAPHLRKPAPYAPQCLMKDYGLSPKDILIVDDSKPGYDCARAAGVDFAAAGWAFDIASIRAFMEAHCDHYLPTVDSLSSLLFCE